jgi:hypothetical protein
MRTLDRSRVSSSALSVALLVCSAVWFIGACAWYANSDSKDGWSSTPLLWILILTVTPLLCLIGTAALVIARRQARFTWFEWCAFFAGGVAVIVGGWLMLMVLSSMRAMGIL